MLPANRGFWLTLLLSIVTLGFYQWYLIHAFSKETNIVCTPADQRKTHGLVVFLLLSVVTFIKQPQDLQVSTYLLTVFLLGLFTIVIMYLVVGCKMLYLQNKMNAVNNEQLDIELIEENVRIESVLSV